MHCVTPFLRQTNNLLVFNFDEPQSYQTVFGGLECIAKRSARCTDNESAASRARAEAAAISAAGHQRNSWQSASMRDMPVFQCRDGGG